MNAGREKITEAETKLPDTSVKSEEKSVSDSTVYGRGKIFVEYFRKVRREINVG